MSQAPKWAARYTGIPFLERGRDRAGCDCWGLVRLVLGERFGVDVPSYAGDYKSVADRRRLAALVETARQERWQEVSGIRKQRSGIRSRQACPLIPDPSRLLPEPGDVLLLRLRGLPIHVGLFVVPGWMLHTQKATNSVLDRFDGLAWRNQVLGVYRHEDLASTA